MPREYKDITQSCTRAAKMISMVRSKKILQVQNSENSPTNFAENSEDSGLKKSIAPELLSLLDEDFDDIYKDPDFEILSESEKEEEIEYEEIQEMGKQIEENMQSFENENMENEATTSRGVTEKKESRKSKSQKRNSGKAYITDTGNFVKEKKMKLLGMCRRKCMNKITPENQKEIFEKYWALGSHNSRLQFINSNIEVHQKQVERIRKEIVNRRNRTHTNKYFFEIRAEKIQVCRNCFLATLNETEQIIKTVTSKKLTSSSGTIRDERGLNMPTNKITEEHIEEIQRHINSFPAYESHYTREQYSQKFFHCDLTLQKMYQLYMENRTSPVSYTKYCQVFHTMGIKFKKPKKDRCNKCEVLKIKIDFANEVEKVKYKSEQEEHHFQASLGYKAKDFDKNLAKNNETIKVVTFDLEKCLPTPCLETSIAFYKRQLWTFNLTVYDCQTKIPVCYMWDETIAKRGGNEIASCLWKYLQSLPANIKQIILYSDSCTGQNKNAFVATMFFVFMRENSNVEIVDHKFLTPGHTHMECDVAHSIIERKKKKTQIPLHHPRDWYFFIRTAGSRVNFEVEEMKQEMFLDFSSFSKDKLSWRKTAETGKKFIWNSVKWIRYEKNLNQIKYKNTLSEEEPFQILNLRKRGVLSINKTDLKPCYTNPIPISKEKKKDILSMIDLIDPIYHDFYKNLVTEDQSNIHPDFIESSDEEN